MGRVVIICTKNYRCLRIIEDMKRNRIGTYRSDFNSVYFHVLYIFLGNYSF